MKLSNEEFCKQYYVTRNHTHCLKWDYLAPIFGDSSLLPMWVADMDFKAPEQVLSALEERVAHGAFGYTPVSSEYYTAVGQWHQKHFGYTPEKQWIRFSPGVVPAIYQLIHCFTAPKDGVILLTPVYFPFYDAIVDTGRTLVESELVADRNGHYRIDFADFEQKIANNNVSLFLLCSPHNPVGRVWSATELETVLQICQKHNVLVISDEIHQDIILDGYSFLSAMAVSEGAYRSRLIVLNSSSKTFNLASFFSSHLFIANETLRRRYDSYMKSTAPFTPNILGLLATQVAYESGSDWKDSLMSVITENYHTFKNTLLTAFPKLVISPLEGTYLAWVDIRAYVSPQEADDFMIKSCKIAAHSGHRFGKNFSGFFRFNLATSPDLVKECCRRIIHQLSLQQLC